MIGGHQKNCAFDDQSSFLFSVNSFPTFRKIFIVMVNQIIVFFFFSKNESIWFFGWGYN